jgi:hypothetical protein
VGIKKMYVKALWRSRQAPKQNKRLLEVWEPLI